MAIIKTEIIKGVKTYTVKKDISDSEAESKLLNKFVTASMINDIIKMTPMSIQKKAVYYLNLEKNLF